MNAREAQALDAILFAMLDLGAGLVATEAPKLNASSTDPQGTPMARTPPSSLEMFAQLREYQGRNLFRDVLMPNQLEDFVVLALLDGLFAFTQDHDGQWRAYILSEDTLTPTWPTLHHRRTAPQENRHRALNDLREWEGP